MKKVSPDPPKFHDFMVAPETKKAGPSPWKGPDPGKFHGVFTVFSWWFLVVKLGTKRSPHGARSAPSLPVPPALFVADVHVGEGCVTAHSPIAGHELFGIGGHVRGLDALDHDVSGLAVLVLRVGRPTNFLVVFWGAIGTIDGDGGPEVVADFLKELHEGGVDKDWVGPVLAPELPYTEVFRELSNAVFCQRIAL